MKFYKIILTNKLATLAAIAAGFAPLIAHADSFTTPFALSLTGESALALLGGSNFFNAPSGELKTDLPNENLTSPYNVAISGIHLTLDYAFNTPVENGSLSEWSIQSKSIAADLVVDAIDATQTIVETSGGTTLNVTLHAVCNNVHLALAAGATSASATVDLALANDQATFVLKDFQATWQPSTWQIVSMDCTGPNGFGNLVKQNITTQLESINPFLPQIQAEIQNQLNATANSVKAWTLTPSDDSGITLSLQPNSIVTKTGGGASLKGTATFNFSHLNQTTCQNTVSTTPTASDSDDLFSMPAEALRGLLHCAYLNQSLVARFTNQQFPAFQSILSNWFLKIFVWPDLVHFNSSSLFQFVFEPTAEPTIGAISSTDDQTVTFSVDAPLKLSLSAPTNAGSQHYVDLLTQISGPAFLSIVDGSLVYQQNTGIGITTQWDPQYVQDFGPNERIWRAVIGHDLRKYLARGGISYALPTWSVPGAFSLTAKDLSSDGTNVNLTLAVQSLPKSLVSPKP